MNILVTGGASGLGEAITKKMAERAGNFVNFTYNNSVNSALKITKNHKNTRAFNVDFTNSFSLEKFAEEIESMDLDVLVNNAITGLPRKHFHKMDAGEFLDGFKNNVMPVILIAQKTIAGFRKKRSGRIINILSAVVAEIPPTGWSAYAAEKAYVLSLSASWAQELSKFNITSNCISPSFMQTALNKDVDERMIEEMKNLSPTGELLSVDEAALAVAKLAEASSEVNGRNFIINPGSDAV
jgi:3-oxoacyl-[acyl-carrier protein] reductase